MTVPLAPVATDRPAEPRSTWWRRADGVRSLITIAVVAACIGIGIQLSFLAFVMAIFSGLVGLVFIPVILFLVSLAAVAAVRTIFGRGRALGTLSVVALAAVLTVTAALRLNTPPIEWTWLPVVTNPIVAIAAVSAASLGLFLRPWWIRVIGGVAAAAALTFIFVPAIQESWQARVAAGVQQQAEAAEDQRIAEKDAAFETYLAESQHPAVPDLPGLTVWEIDAGPEYTTTVVSSPSGGSLNIWVDATGMYETNEASPCWHLMPDPGKGYNLEETLDDYAYFCVRDERGWSRIDGTAAARVFDGKLVTVLPSGTNGVSPSPDEVEQAISSIRFMDDEEFRAAARESFYASYTG
ncbi:hypothetical protein ACFXP7_11055 [Microbacterium sp. P06]|uniref:hypothetical protein n=1 Tax=Microbacterium sp. P06 TaxID=3366949 RepID=UPI003747136E